MEHSIKKRGRYSASFKQEVATEALKGAKTIQQIASEYKISPDVVKERKKQAREMMEEGFKRKGKKKTKEAELEALIQKRDEMKAKIAAHPQASTITDILSTMKGPKNSTKR